jgi:murein DD-endopeptidase MepM/ murein hydrolase activator NlpD
MNQYKRSLIVLIAFILLASTARAQNAQDLKNKISNTNEAITKLEEEIKQYQQQIDVISEQKDSLSNTLKSLDISKKKLEANTKLTQNKIAEKNSEIKILTSQIGDKAERISDGKTVISKAFANLYQSDSVSTLESILGKKSFSEIWRNDDELIALQGNMQTRIEDLKDLKSNLEDNKKLTEKKRQELLALTADLKNQTKIIADTVAEKNNLLKETKNTEANYNKILVEKRVQKEAFEREVTSLESALKFGFDPNTIPSAGTKVLRYPLNNVRFTQYFGNTEFATKNPTVYRGSGHNGVDFAASIGTPVMASDSGIVTNVINAKTSQRCGYGKWITIKHPTGLSTLYAHLSLVTTAEGDSVESGQVIGYSGNTGFTTGPHLHYGVYVTKGLQTIESKSCPGIIIPYAAFNAYLNPLSYL